MSGLILALTLLQAEVENPPGRPPELVQARSCQQAATDQRRMAEPGPEEQLLGLDAMPPCLAPILESLAAEAMALAGTNDATAILIVRVGRAFNETTLFHSSPGEAQIHYVEDVSPISEKLSEEWGDYRSPDGDLGWSGFVLIADKSQTRVRLLSSPDSETGTFERATKLEAEFFPGKQPPQSD